MVMKMIAKTMQYNAAKKIAKTCQDHHHQRDNYDDETDDYDNNDNCDNDYQDYEYEDYNNDCTDNACVEMLPRSDKII